MMIRPLLTCLAITVALWSAGPADAAAVGVDWTSAGNPSTGILAGTSVNMSNFFDNGVTIETQDLSATDPDFDAAPLSASQEVLDYPEGSAWTVTFSAPVTDLLLYAKFWRARAYDFDQPFTIVDGFTGAVVSAGDEITLPPGFTDGILRFSGPITSLSVVPDGGSSSQQRLTFGIVPEPASAALLALGAVALGLRRRRGYAPQRLPGS